MSLSHFIILAKIIESNSIIEAKFIQEYSHQLYPKVNENILKKKQMSLYHILHVLKKSQYIEIDQYNLITPTNTGIKYFNAIMRLIEPASLLNNPPKIQSIKAESVKENIEIQDPKKKEEITPQGKMDASDFIAALSNDLEKGCEKINLIVTADQMYGACKEIFDYWRSLKLKPVENPLLPKDSLSKILRKIAFDMNLVELDQKKAIELILKEYWEKFLDEL
jgi:hypothetical protein